MVPIPPKKNNAWSSAKLPVTIWSKYGGKGCSRSLTISRAQRYRERNGPLLPALPENSASQNFPLRKRGLRGRSAWPAETGLEREGLRKEAPEEQDAHSALLPRRSPACGPLVGPLPLVGRSATQYHTKEAAAITPSAGCPPRRPLPHSRDAFLRARAHTHTNAARSPAQESRLRAN